MEITNGNYTTSTVGNDVVIKVGTGSVKLVGAKKKSINISRVTASEKSTSAKRTSSKRISSANLIADNNFVTGNNQLDSILNTKTYSTDKLDTSTNYGLSQNDSLQSILAQSNK